MKIWLKNIEKTCWFKGKCTSRWRWADWYWWMFVNLEPWLLIYKPILYHVYVTYLLYMSHPRKVTFPPDCINSNPPLKSDEALSNILSSTRISQKEEKSAPVPWVDNSIGRRNDEKYTRTWQIIANILQLIWGLSVTSNTRGNITELWGENFHLALAITADRPATMYTSASSKVTFFYLTFTLCIAINAPWNTERHRRF